MSLQQSERSVSSWISPLFLKYAPMIRLYHKIAKKSIMLKPKNGGAQETRFEERVPLFKFFVEQKWWSAGDSNSLPRQCECRALPGELAPHVIILY